MKRYAATVVLGVFCLAAGATAQMSDFGPAQGEPGQESFWPVVGEAAGGVGAGIVATAVTWGGLYLLTNDPNEDIEDRVWVVLASGALSLITAYPVGSAAGATLAGHAAGQHGSFLASLAGAELGLLAGGACEYVAGSYFGGQYVSVGLAVVGAACPPAGAVIGYNLSNRSYLQTGLESRLLAPEMSFVPVRDAGGRQVQLRAKVRLLSVRF